MEAKAQRLLLVLETLALLTAGILILIDYKLKQDLVTLTRNVESALEDARKLFPQDTGAGSDSSDLHTGNLVDNGPPMETGPDTGKSGQNGKTPAIPRTRTPAKRSGGNRNTPVPGLDNPVGS